MQNECIKEAVVIVKESPTKEKYLVTYAVFKKQVEDSELKAYLRKSLPDYMIPVYFINVEAMPLTPNGKLDIKALPEPNMQVSQSEYEAPRNAIEEILGKYMGRITWC